MMKPNLPAMQVVLDDSVATTPHELRKSAKGHTGNRVPLSFYNACTTSRASAPTETRMKSKSFVALATAGVLGAILGSSSPAAHAEAAAGLALAQQQNCMSCHSVTRSFMGPALHDVAAKYADREDAANYLKHKIMDGSAGVWGPVPMPANTQLTPDQAATLANWVLSLK